MNLKIFQVGEKSVHLHNEQWWNTPDLSGRGSQKELVFSNKKVFQDTRFLLNNVQINITGSIVSTNAWSADEFISYLETFIGTPVRSSLMTVSSTVFTASQGLLSCQECDLNG